MRLITRRDTSLAVTLIVGTLIAFERPFRSLLDFVADIEQRYHIDLLPPLTLLTVVFVFHQYAKRMQARNELAALAQEVTYTRTRTAELERLLTFGHALANAWDRPALEQALWRSLPSFIDQRECCVLSRHASGYEFLVRDARMGRRHSLESVEALVTKAESHDLHGAAAEGRDSGRDVVFPVIVGGGAVGAIVIQNEPALSPQDRLALGTAGSMIAVAMRNARLLHDAQQTSVHDPLTGCVTRAHGLEVLEGELRRARRTQWPLSVIMFDIDHFKQVNDQHGHLQGDAVLRAVGVRLKEVLRSTDVRCRYGGDEFLVILPETPILGAQQVAEGLRRHIAGVSGIDQVAVRVTASLGVAGTLPGELDPVALIARADQALYRAKRAGRDRWCATAAQAALTDTTAANHAAAG